MLTIEELYEVAEVAQARLEEDWRLYALSGDAPVISPAMVRIVASILEARMPQENIDTTVILRGKPTGDKLLVKAINGNTPPEATASSSWAVELVDYLDGEYIQYVDLLEQGAATFRTITHKTKREITDAYICWLHDEYSTDSPTAQQFDERKPEWMSKAQSLALFFDLKWSELVEAALANNAERF